MSERSNEMAMFAILNKDSGLVALVEAGSEVSAVAFGEALCPATFGKVESYADSGHVALLEALTRSLASTGMAEAEARTHAASVLAEKPVGPAVPRYVQTVSGKIEPVTA